MFTRGKFKTNKKEWKGNKHNANLQFNINKNFCQVPEVFAVDVL